MTRLPPFRRDVARNPKNVFIYAGANAWTAGIARAHHVGRNSVLVLPPGEDYRKFRWPVQDVQLLLVWPDGDINDVKAFVAYLIQQGSPHVVAPHPDDTEGCLYARPRRAAA